MELNKAILKMSKNEIINHLKDLYNKTKSNYHDPQYALDIANQYVNVACKKYFGSDILSAIQCDHNNVYQKHSVDTFLFDRKMEYIAMSNNAISFVSKSIPASDKYFVAIINRKTHIESFRRLTMDDVTKAIARVLRVTKLVDAKNRYDPNNQSEIERDINRKSGSVTLTLKDYSFIIFSASRVVANNALKLSISDQQALSTFIKEVYNGAHPKLNPQLTKLSIKSLLIEKPVLFKQISKADKKDWHRLLNKLNFVKSHNKKK